MTASYFRAALVCSLVILALPSFAQESVEDLMMSAISAYRDGRTDEAFALANRAIGRVPGDPTGYFVRGTVYESRQELERALADYDVVVQLSPALALGYRVSAAELNPRKRERLESLGVVCVDLPCE